MDYKEQIESLHNLEAIAYGYNINGEVFGMDCSDFEQIMVDTAHSIEELLARAEAAEARCATLEKMVKEYQEVIIPGYREQAENAERERDAAVSDLTFAVNQYRLFTTDIDLCGLCKFDLPPAGENGQTHECPGFYKDNCFEWRGKKEE